MISKNGYLKRIKTNRIFKPCVTKNGYYQVAIPINGKQKTVYIHRLVANNFIANPNNYNEINHIDGNKLNNNVSNLEWCTRNHNIKEAYRLNLLEVPKGEKHWSSKKVLQYNLYTGEITRWNSMMDIKRELGYSTGAICDACKGNIPTYKNSYWEYI